MEAEQKVNVLFQKFEEYCNIIRNVTVERHNFFHVFNNRQRASISTSQGCYQKQPRTNLQESDSVTLQKENDMCKASEFSKRQTKSISEEPTGVD